MRVITGTARGFKLTTPIGERVVRPTSYRVKESIFNIVQTNIVDSRVLDLFSGSGQIGVEALSRGAEFCVFVDNNLSNQKIIKENLQKTKLFKNSKVVYSDALTYISNCKDKFDFIFLDPPYNDNILEEVFVYLQNVLNDDGIVMCETDKKYGFINDSLLFLKEYKYGNTKITTFRKKGK